MNTSNILQRLAKLETYADLIKQETSSMLQNFNKKGTVSQKKAIHKVAADIVARRNSRLNKIK
jgi:hypothetical protein